MDVADADIILNHVNFSYQTASVLRDLNCSIPKRKVTAIEHSV